MTYHILDLAAKSPDSWSIVDMKNLIAFALGKLGVEVQPAPIEIVVGSTWKRVSDGVLVTVVDLLLLGYVRFLAPPRIIVTYEEWVFRAQYVWVINPEAAK